MKKLGIRLWRFTSESEVVAALRVQGELVKNKMKGGVYSRPPPLMGLFSIGTPGIGGTVPPPKKLFGGTIPIE